MKRIVPRNVIGEHAYFHWDIELKYRRRRSQLGWCEKQLRFKQSLYDRTRYHLREALLTEPHRLAELNATIKSRKKPDEPRRLLLGMHDLDEFVDTILFDRALMWIVRGIDYYGPCAYTIERIAVKELVAEVNDTR